MSNESSGKGGGVLIAIRSEFKSEKVDLTAYTDINCVAAKIISHTGNFYIYTGYVPPKDKTIHTFQRHIEAINSIVLEQNDKLLVTGDYNLPGINWLFDDELQCYFPSNYNCEEAEIFLNELMDRGLFQYCNITGRSKNQLDYIFYSETRAFEITKAPSSLTAMAEESEIEERIHYPMEFDFDFQCKCKASNTSNEPIKSFKRANFEKINDFWENFDANAIISANTIEEAERAFYDAMHACIDENVPTITAKNFSTNHPPWFDRDLINLKNQRDKARKRIKLIKSTVEFDKINEEFINYHNARVAEYQEEQDKLCKENPKKFAP